MGLYTYDISVSYQKDDYYKIELNNIINNHKQIINGREYTVINTHEFNSNEDLSKYGFAKGTYKNDLSFLVHMTNKLNSLNLLNSFWVTIFTLASVH